MSTARSIKSVRVLKHTQTEAESVIFAATNACRNDLLDQIQALGCKGVVLLYLGDGGTLTQVEFQQRREVAVDKIGAR